MTDYRPLVERLVSSLPEQGADARASLYDRLWNALEDQFREDSEGDGRIEAERLALADAITCVEAELFSEAVDDNDVSAGCPILGDDPASAAPQPELPSEGARDEDRVREEAARGTTPVPWPPRMARAALVAGVLCALSIGAGAVGWWSSHRHGGRAAIRAEYDADTEGGTAGASVPAPVGELETADARRQSTGIVAQRAALLVDAPGDTQQLKTYTGRVTWTLVHPEQGSSRAPTARVEADIEIPEMGLRVEVVFDKNAAPELSASHTAQVRFARQPGSPIAGIDRIALPEMRVDGAPTGDPLVGSQVRVTDDVFLIGLADPDRRAANLRLIQSRPWVDLPILLQGHHEAKLTFEKGSTGDAVWAEAIAAWR